MQDLEDREFIDEFGNGADWFFDISRNKPVVSYEATTGVSLSLVNDFFSLIENKNVAILVGVGIQKYFEGAQIMRCIDSFAAFMGYHKKDAGGVWYLSNSATGYENQFEVKGVNKKVSIPKRKRYLLEDLNGMFGVDYKRFADFERKILKPVKEELDDKSDLSFLYQLEEDKTVSQGRKKHIAVTIDLVDNIKRQRRFIF